MAATNPFPVFFDNLFLTAPSSFFFLAADICRLLSENGPGEPPSGAGEDS